MVLWKTWSPNQPGVAGRVPAGEKILRSAEELIKSKIIEVLSQIYVY